ncbi:recombinase family protein [Brevundimonas naejangsanensis]|uniref:recombinase family protein n=1 Tax=Brevundimonas naejangsanensis TaxID=588932 RepID=UPI0026E95BCF|nr:recombinase family protein [Brevundimonas naejangsanensis]
MSQTALIYARFSSTEQAKGYSLERQISQGRKYVEAQGWTLEKVISDEGRSAYSGANRQLGAAFYEFEHEASDGAHSGKVLCVENIDRISRQGAKAAAQLIWRLNELGIDVATWHDGVVYRAASNGDMMELFSVIIKAQMAHEESKKKSQRTNASWKKRHDEIASGKPEALSPRPPAWISINSGEYVLNRHRVMVLNEIYDLYISGIGIYKIVQILNARNEPSWGSSSKPNKGWYLAYVHRLLKLRAVMGEYVTNSGVVLATNHYPQAITAEKFNRAQAVRSSKRSTGGGDRVRINNLLSDVPLRISSTRS